MERQRSGWTEKLVDAILQSRWPTLVLVTTISLAAAFYAVRVSIDTSLEAWMLEEGATMVTYKEFREKFGEDEFIVVAIKTPEVFTPPILEELDRLTRVADGLKHVRQATSLTNVKVMIRSRLPHTEPLMWDLPRTAEEVAEFRKQVSSYPLVTDSLVSADGRSAAILIELSRDCNNFEKKMALVNELRSKFPEHLPDITIHMAGSPVVSLAVSEYIENDLRTLMPVAFLVVLITTFLLFRNFSVPLISLLVVGLAALWVVGVMGVLGMNMNLLGAVLILVILVVGVADSIHIFAAYYQEMDGIDNRAAALQRSLRHVLLPCFVTSVTTIGGFLSLFSSNLRPIREFGSLSALGAAFAFFISIFLIPALIQFTPKRRPAAGEQAAAASTDRILSRLGRPKRGVSLAVLALSVLAVGPAVWSITLLKTTANPMNYFLADDPVRADTEVIDATLGGTANLEFLVYAPDSGMIRWERLQRLDEFERWLEQRPAVTQVMSVVDLLKEYERVQTGRKKLPQPNMIGRRMRLFRKNAPDLVNSYVRDELNPEGVVDEFSLGRISARVLAAEADQLVEQSKIIEDYVKDHNLDSPELRLEATGFVKLMDDMRTYLIESQIKSVLLAFGTITVVMLLLLRSWKMALLSTIPNLGPILAGLSLMALVGIRLDPGTVMIATIALGLVVDDSCHFLVRLREQSALQDNLEDAIAETMRQTGRPIVLTSLILASGFAALVLGSFTTTICFGLVAAFVLLTALFGALVLLPAALLIFRPKL